MRVKLRLNEGRAAKVAAELAALGVEVDDAADLILTEEGYRAENLACRDGADTVIVPLDDICYIETRGRDVLVHTETAEYKTDRRIYQLEAELPADRFVRISNAVIIARGSIRRIRPALSSKFYLTLTCGAAVDVTRTYYRKFKEFYGI